MRTKLIKTSRQIHFMPYVGNFLAVNVIFWIIRAQNWWRFFGFPPMKPDFADLRAYTAQVTCAKNGINYLITNCDPWDRKIELLDIWVPIFRFLNWQEKYTAIIGNTFQILLFVSIYAVAYSLQLDLRKPKNAVLMMLVLVSPPIALLIERGQFEMMFFFLILVSAYLVHSNHKHLAYFVLGFLSVLKIYPILLLGLLLANRRIKNTKLELFSGLVIFVTAAGSIIFSVWDRLSGMQANALSEGYWRTFGVTVSPYLGVKFLNDFHVLHSKLQLSRTQAQFIGLMIIALIILLLFYFRYHGKVFGPNLSPLIEEGALRSIFLLFTLCMVAISYFLISSYDYRMIYMLPLFLLGLSQDNGEKKNRLTIYFAYGIPFVMWCQVFIWTSALAQIPIIISMAMILFNVGPLLLSDYVGVNWAKRLGIFRNK